MLLSYKVEGTTLYISSKSFDVSKMKYSHCGIYPNVVVEINDDFLNLLHKIHNIDTIDLDIIYFIPETFPPYITKLVVHHFYYDDDDHNLNNYQCYSYITELKFMISENTYQDNYDELIKQLPPAISKLEITHLDTEPAYKMSDIIIGNLPNITHLTLNSPNGCCDKYHIKQLPQSLTHLSLKGCILDCELPPALIYFKYNHIRWKNIPQHFPPNLKYLGMVVHGKTKHFLDNFPSFLEELVITYDNDTEDEPLNNLPPTLTHLSIYSEEEIKYPLTMVPSCLTHLSLSDYYNHPFDAALFPNLKCLRLGRNYGKYIKQLPPTIEKVVVYKLYTTVFRENLPCSPEIVEVYE